MKKYTISKKVGIAAFTLVVLLIATLVMIHHNPFADPTDELTKKILACAVLLVSEVAFVLLYDKITVLPVELYQNRKLIWKLAKNDFKKRYAGSYLGMVWALIQPIVTILMYALVFGKLMGIKQELLSGGLDVPYVLYLTAGLIPWFYFQESLTSGTVALIEYNYLVKKVVFKISILPIIKIIAATFNHLLFMGLLLILSICYGVYPSIYTIQIVYYSICLFVFVLALSYSTCAIVVFFKDLQQIIAIALQLGMWATPILWNIGQFSETIQTYIKINPLVYIVNGYRSSLFEKQWFFEDFYSTMYFWIVTVVLFGIGALIFKRLKVHFADVL